MNRSIKILIIPLSMLILSACVKNHSLEVTPIRYGNVIFTFTHNVNGEPLKFDTMMYHTSLGNNYMVTDLQYFISRVSVHSVKRDWNDITTQDGIHYIDGSDNYSCSWWVNDQLPADIYDSVAFIFGIDEEQNITGRFPDPPERDMFWPDLLEEDIIT